MAIYGECETRAGRRAVTITGLGSTECALACDSVNIPLDGEMALWIGAIGPFAVTAIQKNPVQAHAAFKVICPLLSGPISILELATKEEWNGKEAQAGRDYRQAA